MAFDMAAPVRALVIEPGLAYIADIEANRDGVLHGLVGGWLEAVNLTFDQDGYPASVAWLNEDGKMAGLPENPLATTVSLVMQRIAVPADVYVGTVVFTGTGPGGPEVGYVNTDVPEEIIERAQSIAERLGITVEDRTGMPE